jgi:hypothetical protein
MHNFYSPPTLFFDPLLSVLDILVSGTRHPASDIRLLKPEICLPRRLVGSKLEERSPKLAKA